MDRQTDSPVRIVAGIFVIPALRYSLLFLRAPMAFVSIVIPLALQYLVWLFGRRARTRDRRRSTSVDGHERLRTNLGAGRTDGVRP